MQVGAYPPVDEEAAELAQETVEATLDGLRDAVVEEVRRLGRATPAHLREKTGLARKYLIPVLEWLDACGYTVREGDARRLGVVPPNGP